MEADQNVQVEAVIRNLKLKGDMENISIWQSVRLDRGRNFRHGFRGGKKIERATRY